MGGSSGGGGGIGSVLGGIAGGIIGGVATGGNPMGVMAGASLGMGVGKVGGDIVQPAKTPQISMGPSSPNVTNPSITGMTTSNSGSKQSAQGQAVLDAVLDTDKKAKARKAGGYGAETILTSGMGVLGGGPATQKGGKSILGG